MPESELSVPMITTTLIDQYQQLIDQGLVRPSTDLPPNFAYPSALVSVPSVIMSGVSDRLVAQGVLNGGLVDSSHADKL
jgi:hypothetical protein